MRSFTGSHIIQFSLLLISLFLGFLVISPLRNAADERAEILRNHLIAQIEESLGLKITYKSVSPALLSIITVRELTVSFDQGTFTADRVRVFYNPFRRLKGNENDPVRQISRIAVSNSHLDLNLVRGSGKEKGTENSNFDPWILLADKSVDITGFSLNILVDNTLSFTAEDVSLLMEDNRGTVRYSFSGLLCASGPGILDDFGEINSELSSRGIYSPGDSTANGRLDLVSADSDLVVLKPLAVDFTLAENTLTVRRIDDSRPLDFYFGFSDEGWEFSGEAVDLSLRAIAGPGVKSGSWDSWFSSRIDGQFLIESSSIDKNLNYDIDLAMTLPIGTLPWEVDAVLDLSGTDERADIDNIELKSNWGDLSYSGSFLIRDLAPDGRFSFNLGESLLGYPVSAVFNLETENGAISAEPLVFEAAGLDFEDFRFLIIQEPDLYALSLLVVPGRPGDTTVRRLTIDGLIDTSGPPVFHGFTSIQGLDSSYIVKLLGIRSAENIRLFTDSLFNMQGYFEANRDSWVLSVSDGELVDKEDSENSVSFKGRASPGSWSVDSFRISWNDYVVDGRGFGQSLNNSGKAEARLLIDEDIYPLTAKWSSDGRVEIESDFGLNALLGPRSVNGRSIRVVSNSVSIPLKNGRLISDIDVRGRVARNDWDLYLNKSKLKWVEKTGLSEMNLSFSGSVGPGRIVIPDIELVDELGNLSGSAFFKSSADGSSIQGRLFLGSSENEKYEISLQKDHEIWDVGIDIQSALLDRVKRDRLHGRLYVNGSMSGPLEDPLINLDINTVEGILDGQPLEARGHLTMEAGRIRLQDLYYSYQGMSLSRGLFLVDMNKGSVRSTAELNATYNQVPVSTGFSLGVDFSRRFTLLELSDIPGSDFSGTFATRPVLWNNKQHFPGFTFQFVKSRKSFRVRTPDGETLNARYLFDSGKLDVHSGDPMPITLNGGGTVKDGRLNLSFPELSIDPALINYVMFRDPILLQYHVVFQGGRFTGNLDITGSSSDPLINGEVLADNLQVDTPYTYADIHPASTWIHFRDHRVDVDTLEIPIGEGIAYGGGYLILDRLKLVDFDMTYGGKARGRGRGVPVYYPLLGVNLDGVFIGEVRMTGGNKHFSLTGDITFPYLKASLGSAVIPVSQAREGVYPASVDLDFNFITGNNCTFFLPNEQLKIVKASAESGQVINLKYSNNPDLLSITGNLPIKSGDIYYFDRDFQITEGALRFNESLENFDPVLSVRAETKVRDDTGEDVSVALVYNAPIMSDFTPDIETVPARSDLEVMALFGQAVAPYSKSGETDAASTVLLATGGVFGQVGIVQPFEDVLREGLNLDMVTIRTDIIENTLAEGLARGNISKEGSRSTGLGRYLDNTSLFAGKYIGDALFISGTVTANYFEGQRLRSVFGGLEFETSVSLEMETPFFNVAWSYSPDPTRNQNFVADNEISLKWQFSY